MKPHKRINIEQASIKTATVSIKQIQVDARKMTLSLFRQIMEESIIDPDTFDLVGIPWGQINYFWNGCSGDIHVLWQRGNELRRCPLWLLEKNDHPLHLSHVHNISRINTVLVEAHKVAIKLLGGGQGYTWNVRRAEFDKMPQDLRAKIRELDLLCDRYNQRINELKMIDHLFIS